MWEIWANLLLPKALKSCPKSNKSPDLVTLSSSANLTKLVHVVETANQSIGSSTKLSSSSFSLKWVYTNDPFSCNLPALGNHVFAV